jgi:hypothetical protein
MKIAAITAAVAMVFAVFAFIGWRVGRRRRRADPGVARALFPAQRPALEAAFFDAASQSGKPRGLRWLKCEFGDGLELARDKKSAEIIGLLPVTISFEAIPGSDMEGLPAVGNLRAGSAVFMFRQGLWTTAGRAVLNLSPPEALRHFANLYEPVNV